MNLNIFKYLIFITIISLFMPAFTFPLFINNFCITVLFVLMFMALLKFRTTKFLFLYFDGLIFYIEILLFNLGTNKIKV